MGNFIFLEYFAILDVNFVQNYQPFYFGKNSNRYIKDLKSRHFKYLKQNKVYWVNYMRPRSEFLRQEYKMNTNDKIVSNSFIISFEFFLM